MRTHIRKIEKISFGLNKESSTSIPAETRLTVYRRCQVCLLPGPACSQACWGAPLQRCPGFGQGKFAQFKFDSKGNPKDFESFLNN